MIVSDESSNINAAPPSEWDTLAVWTRIGGGWYHTPACSAVRHLHASNFHIGTVREAMRLDRNGKADRKSRLPCRKCKPADPLGLVEAGRYIPDPMLHGSPETADLTPFGRVLHHEMALVLLAVIDATGSDAQAEELRRSLPLLAVGMARLGDDPAWRMIRPIIDRLPCAIPLLQEQVDAERGR